MLAKSGRVASIGSASVTWVMLAASVCCGQFPLPPKLPGRLAIPAARGGNTAAVDFHPSLILLRDKKVQEELGMLESQVEEIDAIRKRASREIQATFHKLAPLGPPKENAGPAVDHGAIRAAIEENQRRTTAEIERVLKPHQSARLKQLLFQWPFAASPLRAYASPEFARELRMSEEQRAAFQERVKEIERQMTEKFKQALEEASSQARGLLTDEQRLKADELSGRPFDFDRN